SQEGAHENTASRGPSHATVCGCWRSCRWYWWSRSSNPERTLLFVLAVLAMLLLSPPKFEEKPAPRGVIGLTTIRLTGGWYGKGKVTTAYHGRSRVTRRCDSSIWLFQRSIIVRRAISKASGPSS